MIDRRVFGSWRAPVAALALGALAACGVEVPDGTFACGDDTECPSGWTCRKPEDRCYRAPDGQDAARADGGGGADAGLDAGHADASAPLDGGPRDAAAIDATTESDGGPPDGDRDGVPDASDCAPLDPSVGAIASRPCARACGGGEEACADGAWAECDAPTVCDCADGATQTIPCGLCGLQSQQCAGAHWGDVGACSGSGVCSPATSEIEVQPCLGGCGTAGTRSRTRTCDGACGWGAWSAFTACASCAPATETATEACGACGQATRTRSCDTASCAWAPWGGLGACSAEGVCAPGDSESEPCGTPTTCGGTRGVRERFCSSSCGWSSWGACDCF